MIGQQAFILRMNSKVKGDRVPWGLKHNRATIGWPDAKGLIGARTREEARWIVHETYFQAESDFRRAGSVTGSLWRFLHEVDQGDLLLVPRRHDLFVAVVAGDPGYDEDYAKCDTAYFRPVEWLNRAPLRRSEACSKLQSRMRLQQTCSRATHLLPAVHLLANLARRGKRG